jgi:hypothetical protein
MNAPRSPADPFVLAPAQGRWLVAGLLALSALAGLTTAAGVVAEGSAFGGFQRLAFSYLTALAFVTSVAVGALAWLLLTHLSGAVWSVAVRRQLENLTRPLALIAVLFIPVLLNLARLYPWADRAAVSADPELARKAAWLNPTFFSIRAAIYFACWVGVARLLARLSRQQDVSDDTDGSLSRRMRAASAWGLVALGVTTTFAAFDWLMSLDPRWTSTMFGVYFWSGSLASSLAVLVLTVLVLHSLGSLREVVTVEHLHDVGKLLFSFVIFWAYIAFSQYFLIWFANFPDETHWYVTRRSGVWNVMSWALVFGHFVLPFGLLIFRATKRSPFWLGFAAVWVLFVHYLDLYWVIMPALSAGAVRPHWLDGSLALALAFLCGAVVARACQTRPLVAVGDHRLAESIAFRTS